MSDKSSKLKFLTLNLSSLKKILNGKYNDVLIINY
jgi:hypothetical protein